MLVLPPFVLTEKKSLFLIRDDSVVITEYSSDFFDFYKTIFMEKVALSNLMKLLEIDQMFPRVRTFKVHNFWNTI